MTNEQIAELKKLCEAATPGPWITGYGGEAVYRRTHDDNESIAGLYKHSGYVDNPANGLFIAAARTALPELIERETAKAVVLGKGMYYICPNCNDEIDYCGRSAPISDTDSPTYCRCCGQRLDWDVPGVI